MKIFAIARSTFSLKSNPKMTVTRSDFGNKNISVSERSLKRNGSVKDFPANTAEKK